MNGRTRAPRQLDGTRPFSWALMSRVVSALFAVCPLAVLTGCSSPADSAEPEITLVVEKDIEEQGILSPILLTVTALDGRGEVSPGVEVRSSARDGLVGEWHLGGCDGDFPMGPDAARVTDGEGTARFHWKLGAGVGSQVVELRARGAAPVSVHAHGLPGVLLVGVWELPDPDARERLPSDTIRLHATNHFDWSLPPTIDAFEEGETLVITGDVCPGAGADSVWPFHLHPASIRTLPPPVFSPGNCIVEPPLTDEELQDALGSQGSRRLCSPLMLVDIEEVPQWYLDELIGEGSM